MLERIFIDNYSCFTNFEFVPGRINLLLGPNGSGKSSLFDVLGSLTGFAGGVHVGELFRSSSLTRWGKEHTQTFELDVRLSGKLFQYKLVVRHDPSKLATESVFCDGKILCQSDWSMLFAFRDDGGVKTMFPWDGTRSVLTHPIFEGDSRFSEFVPFLRENPKSNIFGDFSRSNWLQQANPQNIELLQGLLNQSSPGFTFDRHADPKILIHSGDVEYGVRFQELSSGQQALINLFALLDDARGSCLMLDNPDIYLGLSVIQPWLVMLVETFISQGQVFVASHHPEVIDYMASCQPFWFDRPDNGPVRIRPARFDRESGMSASEQIRRGLFEE